MQIIDVIYRFIQCRMHSQSQILQLYECVVFHAHVSNQCYHQLTFLVNQLQFISINFLHNFAPWQLRCCSFFISISIYRKRRAEKRCVLWSIHLNRKKLHVFPLNQQYFWLCVATDFFFARINRLTFTFVYIFSIRLHEHSNSECCLWNNVHMSKMHFVTLAFNWSGEEIYTSINTHLPRSTVPSAAVFWLLLLPWPFEWLLRLLITPNEYFVSKAPSDSMQSYRRDIRVHTQTPPALIREDKTSQLHPTKYHGVILMYIANAVFSRFVVTIELELYTFSIASFVVIVANLLSRSTIRNWFPGALRAHEREKNTMHK